MAGTTPKPFVFVLMPFSGDFDDIYEVGISPACKAAGAYCERVDRQIFTESILERIYNQISKADIVVADMTGRNANVFYETGYAHALGKPTILLTQKADDIPFDLKHYPHIVYGGKIANLKPELKKRVAHFIKHPEKKTLIEPDIFQYNVNGRNIRSHPLIELTLAEYTLQVGWRLSFDIHYPGSKSLELNEISFGLVFPKSLGDPVFGHEDFIMIDENTYMYLHHLLPYRFLPKGWNHRSIQIQNKEAMKHGIPATAHANMPTAAHNCSVRVFTEVGMKEFPFAIWTKP